MANRTTEAILAASAGVFLVFAGAARSASGQAPDKPTVEYLWDYTAAAGIDQFPVNNKVLKDEGETDGFFEIAPFFVAPREDRRKDPKTGEIITVISSLDADAEVFGSLEPGSIGGTAEAFVDVKGVLTGRARADATMLVFFDDLIFEFDPASGPLPEPFPDRITGSLNMKVTGDTPIEANSDTEHDVFMESTISMSVLLNLFGTGDTTEAFQAFMREREEWRDGIPRPRDVTLRGAFADEPPPTISMPLYEPVNGHMFLHAEANVGISRYSHLDSLVDDGVYSVTADAGETLSFPTDGPVFHLPPGFTAHSKQLRIVDNRWIPIPEPSSAVLAVVALCCATAAYRRRRR